MKHVAAMQRLGVGMRLPRSKRLNQEVLSAREHPNVVQAEDLTRGA